MTRRNQDTRIRVMQVITRLNVGGPSRLVTLAAEGLEKAGFRTLLLAGRLGQAEGGMYDEALSRGIALEIVPELQRTPSPWQDGLALARILSLVRSFRPHIIHTHLSKAGLLGRMAGLVCRGTGAEFHERASLLGILGRHRDAPHPRLVHTFHGHVFSGYFGRTKSAAFLATERLLARFTSKLVVLSESQKQDLASRYHLAGEHRFAVLPLGLEHLDGLWDAADSQDLRSDLRRELGLDRRALLLGTLGRIVPIKDHELLLDAFARLVRRKPHLHLVIVGDGELRPRLVARAEHLRLAERVHFLGWRRDLERIYAGLDLFVLSSKNEGTPVAVIEALAAGLPVVATAVGGVMDLLDGGRLGRLVPHGSPEDLAQAMEEALDWRKAALTARPRNGQGVLLDAASRSRWVRERYSAERFISDLVALYHGLLHD